MANFYKAMAIDQNYFPTREKIKVIVIEIGKAILPASRGKLKTIIMDREEYKKSNKSDHLMTIAINNSDKQKLRGVIADSLDNFDCKNLNDIIAFLGQRGFAFYKEDNLDIYLNDELILLKKLKLNDDQEKAFDVINNKVSELKNWAKKYRNSSESQFHGNVEIDKELDELQVTCAEYTIENDNAGLNAIVERFNKIRISFSLDGLDFLHRTLTNLQSRFIGIQSEVGNLQQAMNEILSILANDKNKKLTEENAYYLLEQEEKFVEIMKLYLDKIDKKTLDLKEKVDGFSKQIVELAPLLLEEGEKLLERELLDGHISMFHKALEAKPFAELENQAELIKEIFNEKLDAVKNNFFADSKRRFERINEQLCPYSEIESAKRILQEVASLQTIFADFSQNNADQLALLIERVTKCVEEADSFHCIIAKQEGDKKTDLRPVIYSITKFFYEEKPVLDKIKQHGEEIRHGYWDADKKSKMLQEISDRANAIKAKNAELFQNTEVDKAKVEEIRDELQGLYSFISSNEETLSRYRGISALKPLAKLWGGGEVTSVQHTNKIKEELGKLNKIVAHI